MKRWLTLLLLAWAALAPQAPAAPPEALRQKIEEIAPKMLESSRTPGAAVAVIHGGAVAWSKGFGFANKAKQSPVGPDTLFQACSISKPVAAWGAMRLVEAGRIALDAPIETYLTRWHLPPSSWSAGGVTLRRLLSHTAGLSLHGYPGIDVAERELPTLEAALSGDTNGAGDVHIAIEPGTKFSYSGGGYTLAQLAMEEVSGRSFSAFMKGQVLEPLGMRANSFEWNGEVAANVATPYDGRGEPLPNFLFAERAAAGLFTSAETLARFGAAAMKGPNGEPPGRGVLKPETLELMLTPAAATEGRYGLGYSTEPSARGTRLAGHGGASRGWRTMLLFAPDRGEGIVVLTNSDYGQRVTNALRTAWITWLEE